MAGSERIPSIEGIEGLELVGRGGFAMVYRGHQAALRRDVAVKVLQRSGLDADDRRRFDRECQAMGALSDHPGIVTLYSAGFTDEEQPYLVMAFVRDGTLHDRLAKHGPMTWHDATALGVRLSGALETAHRAGVLHRDIKPANVLHSEYGDQLSDFGIARIQGGHETQSGVVTASVAHAAPEILDGRRPTAQADVYGLASTLYEALSGKAAFIRDTDEGMLPLLLRVMNEPPPSLQSIGVPDGVMAVIETGMAKDLGERYESAEAFGVALQAVQEQLGITPTALAIVGEATGESDPPVGSAALTAPAQIAPIEEAPAPTQEPGPADHTDAVAPVNPTSMGVTPLHEMLGEMQTSQTTGRTSDTTPNRVTPVKPARSDSEQAPTRPIAPDGPNKLVVLGGALAAVVVLVIGFLVISSGGDDPADDASSQTNDEVTSTTEPDTDNTIAETTAAPVTEPVEELGPQIGLLAPLIDATDPILVGLTDASEGLGVSLAASDSQGAPADVLSDLLAADQNPIIAIAGDTTRNEVVEAVTVAATSNPDVTFVVLDAEIEEPNVVSLSFAEQDGSFVMGAIAAATSATGRVGFLGGADNERLQRYEAGFVDGVRHMSPTTQIDVRYLAGSGELYDDVDAARELATEMYAAGADVIYHAGTSGRGLFQAASEAPGRWAIGVETDQALAADPAVRDVILTSLVKRYDEMAQDALTAAAEEQLTPGVSQRTFDENAFAIASTGDHVDPAVLENASLLADEIAAGAIVVPTEVQRRALVPLSPECPEEGCQIRILGGEPSGSEVALTLEANWTLRVPGLHAHYYWSPRYASEQVGSDSAARFGVAQGSWNLSDSYPVYVTAGAVSLGSRGDDSELCVTAADSGHGVIDPALFDCIAVADLLGN